MAAGCVLRLVQLVANRSLSGDESFLALNVADNPWSHLLHRLDYNQVAPTLFLLAEKVSVTAFGRHELALRLVPFLAGIAALALFPALARRLLHPDAVVLAVLLFALSDPVIAWASTDKQYSVDVLATVLVLLLAARVAERASPPAVAALGATGAVAVWFSFPVSVVLAGAGVSLVVGAARRRDWRHAGVAAGMSAVWLVSFVVEYRLAATGVHALQDSLRGTSSSLVSTSGRSLANDAQSSFRYVTGMPQFLRRGQHDVGQILELLVALLWLVGLARLARTRLFSAAVIALPLVFALGAALAHAYPFLPRAMLYMAVPLVLGVAEGGSWLVGASGRVAGRTAGLALILAAVSAMAALSIRHTVTPRATQEMRPTLGRLAEQARRGDTIYVLYSAQYGLRWYLECGCVGHAVQRARAQGIIPLRRGPDGPEQWPSALASVPPRFLVAEFRGHDPPPYVTDLRGLRGRTRVWVLLANVPNEFRQTVLDALDREGTRLSSFRADGDESAAAYYLYDLT